MPFELGFTTLKIIAASKIILFIFAILLLLAVFKKNKPWIYSIMITFAISVFYFVLSNPMQKMFWGNNGDEVFIFSFLSKVLAGDYFKDFYYSWLTPFYPPLYFWITGTIAKIFTQNGISAAKIGTLLILLIWFVGPYVFQKLFWALDQEKQKISITKSSWFWMLSPIIFFLMLDFDAIILKPYETLPALFCVLLAGMIAESLDWTRWTWKNYLFIGISGGLLFLTYYFWWFVLIPSIFILILLSKNKLKNILRMVISGLILFAISAPYLIPLIYSYTKYGIENWQAAFFVPQDLSTFMPWGIWSLKSLLFIAGLAGLIISKAKFIKASLITFVVCYLYQFLNIVAFISGKKSALAAKPFLFLGSASLAVGAAYLVIYLFQKYTTKLEPKFQRLIVIILILVFLPLVPMAKFIDDPVAQSQIEKDLEVPKLRFLAQVIQQSVPSYKNRIWLSSGAPELNAYVPLTYYIAHNPHFSHQAVGYSNRLKQIEQMSEARTPDEFMTIISAGSPRPIDSLLLYYDKSMNAYQISFWQDNYPNGGKDFKIGLPAELIDVKYWEEKYNDGKWRIYLKR